jgi:hypothetical protein
MQEAEGGIGRGLNNQTRRRNKILLVEDEPDICTVYQLVLEMLALNAFHTQIQSQLCKNSDLAIMI